MHSTPGAKRPPQRVAINPADGMTQDTAAALLLIPEAFAAEDHTVEQLTPEVMTLK